MVRLSAKSCNFLLCLFLWLLLITCYIYFFVNAYKYQVNNLTKYYHNEDHNYGRVKLKVSPRRIKLREKMKTEVTQIMRIPFKLPFHDQEDPKLVEYVRSQLVPPAPKDQKYFLRLNEYDTSQGQAQFVRQLLNYKRDGFFVECGGGDGEFFSNTLFLEKHLNWTGLLVEADPIHAEKLLTVHRKAWFSPFCLSLNTSTYQTFLKRSIYTLNDPLWKHFGGKVQDYLDLSRKSVTVTCVPFYTHMLALNVTKVDYFSLDVEGNEVEILESVPFNKVDVDTLSVEFDKSRGGKPGVVDTMGMRGYKAVKEFWSDLIFVKQDLKVISVI